MAAPIRDPYTEPTTLVARPATQLVTAPKSFPLRTIIEGHGDVLGPVCRSHNVEPEAVIAQLWVASQKQPGLLKATPASLVTAVARALETGGVIGRDVHILTFGNEAVECVDYKYMVELVVAAGGARSIDARVVHQADTFKQTLGSFPSLVHEPPPFGQKRGPVIGFYAVAFLGANVPPKFVALTLEEVESVRKLSKSWNPSKVKDCPEWYGMKRAIRVLVKLLPKNPKLASLIARLDAAEAPHEAAEEIEGEWATIPEGVDPETGEVIDSTVGLDEGVEETIEAPVISAELARALDYTVKGRTLGQMPDDDLRKLEQWALDKGNTRVADMAGLVVGYRTRMAAMEQLDLVPE